MSASPAVCPDHDPVIVAGGTIRAEDRFGSFGDYFVVRYGHLLLTRDKLNLPKDALPHRLAQGELVDETPAESLAISAEGRRGKENAM
jgi:hypothetical protein